MPEDPRQNIWTSKLAKDLILRPRYFYEESYFLLPYLQIANVLLKRSNIPLLFCQIVSQTNVCKLLFGKYTPHHNHIPYHTNSIFWRRRKTSWIIFQKNACRLLFWKWIPYMVHLWLWYIIIININTQTHLIYISLKIIINKILLKRIVCRLLFWKCLPYHTIIMNLIIQIEYSHKKEYFKGMFADCFLFVF